MNKKSLLIIIMAVTIALLVAFGTIFLFLKKVDEKEEEPEIIEEVDLNKIDYEQLQTYSLDKMTIKIVQTASKPHYLILEAGFYVTDEEMLTRMTTLNSKIKDVVLGVFEDKTAEQLEGNREVMKQAMLESVREIFVKQADKEKIVDVSITNYMISQ
ncbi:MAG: flagellar basal body-associated FliL family protein [Clostridiales bacterium]|nr:flagellar basal body-associated FliL family protein [Clostridiales bacterium]